MEKTGRIYWRISQKPIRKLRTNFSISLVSKWRSNVIEEEHNKHKKKFENILSNHQKITHINRGYGIYILILNLVNLLNINILRTTRYKLNQFLPTEKKTFFSIISVIQLYFFFIFLKAVFIFLCCLLRNVCRILRHTYLFLQKYRLEEQEREYF